MSMGLCPTRACARGSPAIITLLEKKGKDKRVVKNWPPISLINVDAKIISKVLAKRLEKILPNLIHTSQNAFVKGRSIFDAIRTIDDIVDSPNGTVGRDL